MAISRHALTKITELSANDVLSIDLDPNNSSVAETQRGITADTLLARVGGASGPTWSNGSGTPEGSVTGSPGDLYSDTDGGAGVTLYVKESGTGNTGWVAK